MTEMTEQYVIDPAVQSTAMADLIEAKNQIEQIMFEVQGRANKLCLEPVTGEEAEQLRGEIAWYLVQLAEHLEAYRRRCHRHRAALSELESFLAGQGISTKLATPAYSSSRRHL